MCIYSHTFILCRYLYEYVGEYDVIATPLCILACIYIIFMCIYVYLFSHTYILYRYVYEYVCEYDVIAMPPLCVYWHAYVSCICACMLLQQLNAHTHTHAHAHANAFNIFFKKQVQMGQVRGGRVARWSAKNFPSALSIYMNIYIYILYIFICISPLYSLRIMSPRFLLCI